MQGATGPACALLAKGVQIATQIVLLGTCAATMATVVPVIRALTYTLETIIGVVLIATHAPWTTETSTFGPHWAMPPLTPPLGGIVHCIE